MDHTLTVINDFLGDNHIRPVIDHLDQNESVTIQIIFTEILVRDPFTLSLSMSSNRKNVSEEEKCQSLNSMFLQVNATIMSAVYTAGPILH